MTLKSKHYAQEEFSRRLKTLMTDRTPKVTHQALADYIGVERQSVTNYLRGVCIPRADTLAGIARYFGVTADWLLGMDTKPPREMTMEEAIEVLQSRSGLTEKACRALMSGDVDALFMSRLIENPATVSAIKAISKFVK